MNNSEIENLSKNKTDIFKFNQFLLAILSLCALIVTFFAANSGFPFQTKLTIFLFVIFLYLFCCAALYLWQKRGLDKAIVQESAEISKNIFNAEIEMKLLALEEANQFFGASLKSADMFRLVSSRIKEIIPFASSALFLAVENNSKLKAVFADGENAKSLAQIETDSSKGITGKTFFSRSAQSDDKLLFEKSSVFADALKNLNAAICVPLSRETEIFGVLALYANEPKHFGENALELLEAVGTRVAPLFLSSFAFEKNLSNALTDSLTELPNERAFYLVVENKLAETQRFREARSLSVLTIDIKGFSEINRKFGHATGDRILTFVAKIIKDQLREMDFLARSMSDEFLAVLPTADQETTKEIVGRVQRAFLSSQFAVSRQEKINLALNFGAATFWKDGETVGHLLQHARLRKQQSKTTEKSKVLWFPQEFVN